MFDLPATNLPVAYMLQSGGDPENRPWEVLRDSNETGPGFQYVDIANQWDEDDFVPYGQYIVFNCEFFVDRGFLEERDTRDTLAWPKGQRPASTYEAFILQFRVLPKTKLRNASVIAPSRPRSTLILSTRSTAGEVYWRLSAYANDRRITNDRRLVKGTYITSDSDIEVVGSGFAAVGRYALPNPFPSIYAFAVQPRPGTPIDLGTVRPNYGQAGGGVEGVLGAHSGRWTVANHTRVLPAW